VLNRIHPTVVAPVTHEFDSKSSKRRHRHGTIIIPSSTERGISVQVECLSDWPTEQMLLAETGRLTLGVAEEAAHPLTVVHEFDQVAPDDTL
jgi:hypothetical protein